MKSIKNIGDLALSGRRVFVRLDLDAPVADGVVTADLRVRAALPTVRHALEAGAGLVLGAHLGGADGRPDPRSTLEPVGARLSELLGLDVILADDCVGDGVRSLLRDLRPGGIVLFENLRFHAGETANGADFVKALVDPFDLKQDLFVNDAFAACHRAHASIVGVAPRFAERAAGFALARGIEAFTVLLAEPERPFVAVVGGASDAAKLAALDALVTRVDTLCIGGAIAGPFLAAARLGAGAPAPTRGEEAHLQAARNLLTKAKSRGVRVVLPVDHVVVDRAEPEADAAPKILAQPEVGQSQVARDIGPGTRAEIATAIASARTLFWCGPMGACEREAFAAGTLAVARAAAAGDAFTVVAGSDTVAAVEAAGLAAEIDHLCFGGDAALELMQFGTLPGIAALRS